MNFFEHSCIVVAPGIMHLQTSFTAAQLQDAHCGVVDKGSQTLLDFEHIIKVDCMWSVLEFRVTQ